MPSNEREIFGAALALEPRERAQYVRRVCGDDEDLAARILQLLTVHAGSDGFLEPSVRSR